MAPAAQTPMTVQVYSAAPQPYITEVFVDTDATFGMGHDPNAPMTGGNPKGYVAIELYNPCSVAVNVAGWQLAVLDRRPYATTLMPAAGPMTTYPNMQIDAGMPNATTPVPSITPGQYIGALLPTTTNPGTHPETLIPPHSYLILENYTPGTATGNDAIFRPSVAGLPASGALQSMANSTKYPNAYSLYVQNLDFVINDTNTRTPALNVPGGELVILRPRMYDTNGNPICTSCVDPDNYYNEGNYTVPGITGSAGSWTFTPLTAAPPLGGPSGAPILSQMVPVDSFDFTGISQMATALTDANYTYLHYVRSSDTPNPPPPAPAIAHSGYWHCVWPGRYDGTQGTTTSPRQETLDCGTSPSGNAPMTSWQSIALKTAAAFGAPGNSTVYNAFPATMFGDPVMPGPNPLNGMQATFPYGGFARDGDLLQVPFVGAYTVFLQTNFIFISQATLPASQNFSIPFLEMNSLPMDLSFADDVDSLPPSGAPPGSAPSDDPVENIGRFCPVYCSDNATPAAYALGQAAASPPATVTSISDPNFRFEFNGGPATTFVGWNLKIVGGTDSGDTGTVASYNDAAATVSPSTLNLQLPGLMNPMTKMAETVPPGNTSVYIISPPIAISPQTTTNGSAYFWTGNIFHYLSVTDPSDDYIPNVDPGPNVQSPVISSIAMAPYYAASLPSNSSPIPVNNDDYTKNGDQTQEQNVGIDGLVNINTASAKVLSMLPWCYTDAPVSATSGIDEAIANAIVADRNANGAYNSVMDLARVNVTIPVTPVAGPPVLVSIPLPLVRAIGSGPVVTPVNPVTPTSAEGNILSAPLFGTAISTTPTLGDFQTQFLALDRVSNLITTRSDSFTVYVVVEGWTNPGTAAAQLVSTRRVGYIVDRSGINQINNSPKLIAIPQN
jgi:hypothetical protein